MATYKPLAEATTVATAGRVGAIFSAVMINKFTCLRELFRLMLTDA